MPYVFTEQGVAMLSSVLRSERVHVDIEFMCAFARLFLDPVNGLNGAKRLNDWNGWNGLRHYVGAEQTKDRVSGEGPSRSVRKINRKSRVRGA